MRPREKGFKRHTFPQTLSVDDAAIHAANPLFRLQNARHRRSVSCSLPHFSPNGYDPFRCIFCNGSTERIIAPEEPTVCYSEASDGPARRRKPRTTVPRSETPDSPPRLTAEQPNSAVDLQPLPPLLALAATQAIPKAANNKRKRAPSKPAAATQAKPPKATAATSKSTAGATRPQSPQPATTIVDQIILPESPSARILREEERRKREALVQSAREEARFREQADEMEKLATLAQAREDAQNLQTK